MAGPLGEMSSLVDIAEKLGIIQSIKSKLVRQPDPACDALVTVLEEISKIYSTLSNAFSQYLSLSLVEASDLKEEMDVLLRLAAGTIGAEMGKARGHCAKITNIYDRYLSPWFLRVLSPTESQRTREFFEQFQQFDVSMVRAIDVAARWLEDEANAVLLLANANKLAQADETIRADRAVMLPTQRAMARALHTLFDLQADFVEMSGAI